MRIRSVRLQNVSCPEDAREEKDDGHAQENGIRGTHLVAAGDPGQTIEELREGLMRTRLLFLSVLAIAVVLILELLQVPEVSGERQVHRAIKGNVLLDGIPADGYASQN